MIPIRHGGFITAWTQLFNLIPSWGLCGFMTRDQIHIYEISCMVFISSDLFSPFMYFLSFYLPLLLPDFAFGFYSCHVMIFLSTSFLRFLLPSFFYLPLILSYILPSSCMNTKHYTRNFQSPWKCWCDGSLTNPPWQIVKMALCNALKGTSVSQPVLSHGQFGNHL